MGNNSNSSQRIYIENSEKKRFPLDIDLTESIKTIKDIIYKQKGIPQRNLILCYNGKKLEDHNTLQYYNIKKDSIIQLIISSFDKSKTFIEKSKLNENDFINQLLERNNSSLSFKSKDEKGINIIIKTLTSQINFIVKPYTNIINIKKTLQEKLGVPVEKQTLLYRSIELEDNKSISEYNIINDSILSLLPKKENLNKKKK